MDVRLDIQVDTSAVEARLNKLADDALEHALVMGLAEGGELMAGDVVRRADAAGIKGRTGTLLPAVTYWAPREDREALLIYVGVPDESPAARYAYLLTEMDKHIVPHGHKYLAIPIGENLTGAGVARFDSPRQLGDDLTFRGRTAGIEIGEEYSPYFALVEEVWVFGRGVLEAAAEAARGMFAEVIQEHVDGLLADAV